MYLMYSIASSRVLSQRPVCDAVQVEVQRLARSRPKRIEVIAFDDFGEFSTPPSQVCGEQISR
jgi:hypothetical protein